MTLEEIDELLLYWEQLDGGWDAGGETRRECIDVLADSVKSLKEWKEVLVKIPTDLTLRYQRVLVKLEEEGLIDEAARYYELSVMHQFSPAMLVRRGRFFAETLKQYKESPLYKGKDL
jgi:predicted transcriptional regulator